MNIIDAIDDPEWWAPWFERGDWSAWRVFLAAVFALPMAAPELAIYRECTGRTKPPKTAAQEAWAICGRRAGKTRVMATVAAFLAVFRDWRPCLAPGEVATVMVLAKDRKQARVAMRYLRSLFIDHPKLAPLVERETEELLELANRVVVEVTTASFRSVRGYTVCALIADELAFWIDDEGSSNPAAEVIDALRPAMLTMPGALLMVATSPYAKRGPVWDTYRRYYGKSDPVLVWKAPTRRMNSQVPQKAIDAAYEKDPAAAAAEYGAEFRSDLESFIAREVVESVTVSNRHELPPAPGRRYVAFCDPSGGSSDAMTLAISHAEGKTVVLVVIRERRPPFSPDNVVKEFSSVMRAYDIRSVTGDRYGGEWPRERFRAHGVSYEPARTDKKRLLSKSAAAAKLRPRRTALRR